MNNRFEEYTKAVKQQFATGHALEHAYRPALERLMSSFEDVHAINDPKRSEHGNPDFIFIKKSNKDVILGYAEAKDITIDLDKIEKTNQMHRYSGYENLFLTDYLEFRFYQNGDKYQTISIGSIKNDEIILKPENYSQLENELSNFLELPPESIKSGKRLAKIMGAKARRVRDNVEIILKGDSVESNKELEKIYKMMQSLLVHDLTVEKFADMYAQTLVYGLFVARYNDKTLESFSRQEARDLVPKSNPFLQHFFDHIVGPDFVISLSRIVDELCEVFEVSDVHTIVHKHLKILDDTSDKDPIIHFYEDFLKEYDPQERKKMGAYYTPIPVVQFIIRKVDDILKRDFGLAKGLADTSMKSTGTYKDASKVTQHRVQVLDPAVGTATFLNEIIKYIHKQFEGQEGRWQSYVEQDLIPRLFGFELMMAPYTIAHLKLGMTLQETGVEDLQQRLNVYLTNTLEEGIKNQQDIFSFGLAEAVSDEGEEAAKIKYERPIMVIVGNPPYSVSSNNKSEYIEKLTSDYKKDLKERNIQPLSDDYIKFIRFAEEMIIKNGEGVVAMITNNSYIDGIIHRQMRKHLLETFHDIYILNLHGSKKVELYDKTRIDENVFNIQQGVSIIILVKKSNKLPKVSKIYFSEIIASRADKFSRLLKYDIDWELLHPIQPYYFFSPKKFENQAKYLKFISVKELFRQSNAGSATGKDAILVADSEKELVGKLELNEIRYNSELVTEYNYRIWDEKFTIYDKKIIQRLRTKLMNQLYKKNNLALITTKILSSNSYKHVFISNKIGDRCLISNRGKEANYYFPLYIYHDDGTKAPNFDPKVLKELTKNLTNSFDPEGTLDYIYAVLHSPIYREDRFPTCAYTKKRQRICSAW
jgi:predicted helicase